MNTSYFREFIVLVETRSYWEASERLYMNQSTLSKHIKAMENELDVPLFERSTRRVELTPYGKTLLPFAQSIIREETEYSSLFQQMKNQEQGLLVIGSIPVMAQYGILNHLTTFQQEHPNNNIKILEEDPQNLFDLLRSRKCELAFQRESKLDFEKNFMEDHEFVRIPIVRDHLVALFPARHPLSENEQVNLRELKDENFCMLKEGTLMHNLCIDACHASGFLPKITYTSHRIENLLDMICTGDQIGLLMNCHLNLLEDIQIHAHNDWSAVPVSPRIYSQISLCYLANVPLSPAAKDFANMISKIKPDS